MTAFFPILMRFAEKHDLLYNENTLPDKSVDGYVYSNDMQYRYAFARRWAKGPLVFWVGVNPAKGDTEKRRRPTLERCIGWSRTWNAGGLMFGNLFAGRHNKPRGLLAMKDPVGVHNDHAIIAMSKAANRTIAAWGGGTRGRGRVIQIAPLLKQPQCLGVTKSGQPRHPLYVRSDTQTESWPIK